MATPPAVTPQGRPEGDLHIRPGSGIGPIDLGQTYASVKRRLGAGHAAVDGRSFVFSAAGAPIRVAFDARRPTATSRVVAIETSAPRFQYRSVHAGMRYRAAQVHLSGWISARCHKVWYAYRNKTPTGPSTAFGHDRLLGFRAVVQDTVWRDPCPGDV